MPNARDIDGEGVVAVTREQFYTSAIRLAKENWSDGMFHIFQLFFERFAYFLFINDVWSLLGEVVLADERTEETGSEKAMFLDKRTARLNYKKFIAVSLRATRNICP